MKLFGFKDHGFGSKAAGFWWEWRVRVNASCFNESLNTLSKACTLEHPRLIDQSMINLRREILVCGLLEISSSHRSGDAADNHMACSHCHVPLTRKSG